MRHMDKKRVYAYLTIILFLTALIAPRLLFIPLKSRVDINNYENRTYQEKPKLSLREIQSYPALYEAYFNDHLAFKNQLVMFGKLLDINLFREITSEEVLIGRDHWLFYKYNADGGDCIADYRGTNRYSNEELALFADKLSRARRCLSDQGIRLIYLIVPNKERVYCEYLPPSVTVVKPEPKADQLVSYLMSHTQAEVIYPFKELVAAKKNWCQVYRKYDTHWNDMGAFLVAQLVIDRINDTSTDYTQYPIVDHGTFSGDLATMLNLQSIFDDDAFIKVGNYHEDVRVTESYANQQGTMNRYQSDAAGRQKILICRDSFGIHMADYFSRNFSDVTFLDYRSEDCAGFIRKEHPDVVIVESAERYTGYMFDFLETLAQPR